MNESLFIVPIGTSFSGFFLFFLSLYILLLYTFFPFNNITTFEQKPFSYLYLFRTQTVIIFFCREMLRVLNHFVHL